MGTQIPKKVPMGTRVPKWGPIGEQCRSFQLHYSAKLEYYYLLPSYVTLCGYYEQFYVIVSSKWTVWSQKHICDRTLAETDTTSQDAFYDFSVQFFFDIVWALCLPSKHNFEKQHVMS